MTTVDPIADHHAIKTVSFGLEWPEPLQDDLLILLRALHVRVRKFLPRVTQQEELGFEIAVGSSRPKSDLPPKLRLAAVTFDSVQRNGEQEWSLVIQRNVLAVNCHVYTRWDEIWTTAKELLMHFVPILARERGIAVIGLQYVDQFRVTSPTEHFRAEHLLRQGSSLLPSHVFERDDLWHLHQGFFETQREPTAHRRLNHLALDVVDVSGERLIQITTAHRALLDEPASNVDLLLDHQDGGTLSHHMVALHQVNKGCLRELLNDSICERIGLGEMP